MGQQDNKPNNQTTVNGQPLFGKFQKASVVPATEEYIAEYVRDDDPLLSPSERGNTRGDILNSEPEDNLRGASHPV